MTTTNSASINEQPLDLLHPSPSNLRGDLGDLTELAASIEAKGVLEPIKIVPSPPGEIGYRIVDGHRRHAAARLAGQMTVPTLLRSWDEQQQLEVMLVTALHREDLTPLEESDAYWRLLKEFELPQTEIAKRAGRSDAHVSKRLSLRALPAPARTALETGQITLATALGITGLAKHKSQLNKVVAELGRVNHAYGTVDARVGRAVREGLADVDRSAKVAQAKADAKAAGLKIVAKWNSWEPKSPWRPVRAKETATAAHVDEYGKVTKLIESTVKDPTTGKAKPKAQAPAVDDELERKTGHERAGEISTRRRAFCLTLITGDVAVIEYLAAAVVTGDGLTLASRAHVASWLDLDQPLPEYAATSTRAAVRAAVSLLQLAVEENIEGDLAGSVQLNANSWDADQIRAHYAWLEANGYELTPEELTYLGRKPAKAAKR